MAHRVRVWDLPTRLFHWLLVFFVVALVATAKIGGGAMVWHSRMGYAVLTLLLFRLAWGLVGGRWSRFASFVYSPRSVMAYLRGRPAHPDHLVGHNPLGAGSVFAMLLVLLVQATTGLFTDDEISFTGPLNRLVSTDTGLALTSWHRGWGEWLIWGLVVLHLLAVGWYTFRKRQGIVRPMVVGDKELAAPAPASRDDALTRLLAVVVLAACAGFVTWLVTRAAGAAS
jgi:cytochrome b